MGWCSGTDVFDDVMSYVLSAKEIDKVKLVEHLIRALENHDWDCQGESRYWEDLIVQTAYKNIHEKRKRE